MQPSSRLWVKTSRWPTQHPQSQRWWFDAPHEALPSRLLPVSADARKLWLFISISRPHVASFFYIFFTFLLVFVSVSPPFPVLPAARSWYVIFFLIPFSLAFSAQWEASYASQKLITLLPPRSTHTLSSGLEVLNLLFTASEPLCEPKKRPL
jgi:hypothetical protein